MTLNSLNASRSLDPRVEVQSPSVLTNYLLPSTGIRVGASVVVVNTGTADLQVQASDATNIRIIPPNGASNFSSLQDTPTTSTHWKDLKPSTKWQLKTLSATFTTTSPNAAEITDLRFSNLVVGKTYRFTFSAYASVAGDWHFWALWGSNSNTADFGYWRMNPNNDNKEIARTFKANATTLKFYGGNGTTQLVKSDTNVAPSGFGTAALTTFAILEELPDHEVTTAFT